MKKNELLYYFSIFFPIVLTPIVFIHFFGGSSNESLVTLFDQILYYSKFFWFTGAWFVVTNTVGLLKYGNPDRVDEENLRAYRKGYGWEGLDQLIVTYVSRGDNFEALDRSLRETQFVLRAMKVNYAVEVVTDIHVAKKLEHHRNVKFYLVPSKYRTEKGAQYKARALHYVLQNREVEKNQQRWILHLDEESCLTPSAVAGIAKFICEQENYNKVGQGEIQYNSYNYGQHLLNTAIDAVRTGDDLGRFRFQYKMVKKPLFGMHGSFILVPEHIERHIGFDLGGRGSITEDAYFALISSDTGYSFGWVDGHIREQSPFSVMAIIKQRRRWFCGLWLLSFDPVISLKTRLPLMINTILWAVAWIGPVVTFANIFSGGGYFPLPLMFLASLIQGAYAAVYLVGAYRNLSSTYLPLWKKVLIYLATYLLLPVSSVIEGLAIMYAIVSPVKTFDVVKK